MIVLSRRYPSSPEFCYELRRLVYKGLKHFLSSFGIRLCRVPHGPPGHSRRARILQSRGRGPDQATGTGTRRPAEAARRRQQGALQPQRQSGGRPRGGNRESIGHAARPARSVRGAASALYRRGIGPVQAAGNQTRPGRSQRRQEIGQGAAPRHGGAGGRGAAPTTPTDNSTKPRRNTCRCCSRTKRMFPPWPTSPRSSSISDHLEAAEINIKQAVALAPDDPYSLFVLGRLRFRQKKYDEAIDALSRAAKLDPQDAQIQNFLGLALSEKGLRGPGRDRPAQGHSARSGLRQRAQ